MKVKMKNTWRTYCKILMGIDLSWVIPTMTNLEFIEKVCTIKSCNAIFYAGNQRLSVEVDQFCCIDGRLIGLNYASSCMLELDIEDAIFSIDNNSGIIIHKDYKLIIVVKNTNKSIDN